MSKEEEYDPIGYWRRRAERHISEGIGVVVASGSSPFVSRVIHRLEERALKRAITGIPLQGRVLLDAGCGIGRWFPLLEGAGGRVMGCDVVPLLLTECRRRRPGVPVTAGDVRSLPFRDSVFDVVLTVKVLQYIPRANQPSAVGELCRVLRPGGYLLLMEAMGRAKEGDTGRGSRHIFPNRPEEWIEMARRGGAYCLRWFGVDYMPVDRGLEIIRRAIYRLLRPLGQPKGAYSNDRSDTALQGAWRHLHNGYLIAKWMALHVSLGLEPLFSCLMPRRWACHGMFIFRKRGQED